jgi:hypothetical protein
MSASGETVPCKSIGSKPKRLIETKFSPSALLSTIDKIEKLIDEVPEEFVLDVQTAVNKMFQERLAVGAVIRTEDCRVTIVCALSFVDVVVKSYSSTKIDRRWNLNQRMRSPPTFRKLNR